jgi:hypothetical protein
MHRHANWAVDKLSEIDLDRIEVAFARKVDSVGN